MPLPAPAPVSAHRLGRFAADGFLVLQDLIPAAVIEALRAEADTVLDDRLAGMAATRTPDPRVIWWCLPSGRLYVLKIKPVIDVCPTASAVADSDEIRAVVAELLGAAPRLMENKFMYKQVVDIAASWANLPVLGEEVCKHTDAAYFSARRHDRVLTVAICLDPCTERSGALRVWPGSHRRSIEIVATDHQGPVVTDNDAPDTAAVRARPEITFTKSCCVVECMYVRFGCGVCARREVRAAVAASQ